MPVGQEQRDGALVVGGGVADHQAPEGARLADQVPRTHHESEAQAGRQGLRKTGDENDPAAAVEGFQRRLRAS